MQLAPVTSATARTMRVRVLIGRDSCAAATVTQRPINLAEFVSRFIVLLNFSILVFAPELLRSRVTLHPIARLLKKSVPLGHNLRANFILCLRGTENARFSAKSGE